MNLNEVYVLKVDLFCYFFAEMLNVTVLFTVYAVRDDTIGLHRYRRK